MDVGSGASTSAAMGGAAAGGTDAAGAASGSSGASGAGRAGASGGSGGLAGGAPGGMAGDVPDGGEPSEGSDCTGDADCEGLIPCATLACQSGACVGVALALPGTACGSNADDECTNPDTCDGQGVCQRNDELATACEGGTCSGGQCIATPLAGCAVDVVSSVPFTSSWSSVGRTDLYGGGCDSQGTPEYALVFTAPQAGTYRVTSTAMVDTVPYTGAGDASGIPDGPADGDSVMTVVRGDCAGPAAQQLDCNDDVAPGTLNSGLDFSLSAGEVVTVYLNELTQTGGGTGTVNVALVL